MYTRSRDEVGVAPGNAGACGVLPFLCDDDAGLLTFVAQLDVSSPSVSMTIQRAINMGEPSYTKVAAEQLPSRRVVYAFTSVAPQFL